MKTKRFVLMAGLVYYASGGFMDFRSSFDTKEEAEAAMEAWLKDNPDYTWAHIGDLETGELQVRGEAHNTFGKLL
jgi:hypothetical protein